MLNRLSSAAPSFVPRLGVSVVLAALLLAWVAGLADPAHADHEPDHNPVARLELEVKYIIVHDDSEYFSWEEGEILIVANVWEVPGGCTPATQGELWWYWSHCQTPLALSDRYFTADSGETVAVNMILPSVGDNNRKEPIGLGIGFPVYADRTYGFQIKGDEIDPALDDELGDLAGWLNAQNNWGLGTWEERGWVNTSDPTPQGEHIATGAGFCARIGPIGCGRALFSAEYEIRRVPLPDLQVNTIRLVNADPLFFYCPVVENVGQQPSEMFQITLSAGSTFQRTTPLGALDVGQTTETCVLRSDLPSGETILAARVDPARAIAEMDETNNFWQWGIGALPIPPVGGRMLIGPGGPREVVAVDPQVIQRPTAGQPTAGPSPNLEVKAITVKGKQPTGNNDCDPGENEVTVVVKNEGNAAAASFLVRLTVGNQTKEKTATNLDAGKEVNVSFDDLMLTAGQHKLSATANVPNPAALTLQDDAKLEVNVSCANE